MHENTFLTIGLSRNSIRVFRNALRSIGAPPYVRFLLNPETNRIAMAPSFKKDFTSFKVPKGIMDSNDKNSRVCVFSKPLCTAIFRQFGWDKGKTYRIPGRMFPDQQVVIYYIDDAFRIEKDRWLRPSEDNF